MPLRNYPNRVLFAAALASLLALGICGVVAVYLHAEQARTADVLSEDIGSRGAAINLEVTLNNLMSLQDRRSRDLGPLHEQVLHDLDEIGRFADKDQERVLVRRITDSFAVYLHKWQESVPSSELADWLRHETLPAVQALRTWNGRALNASEEAHRQSLRLMTWGLVVVGALASVAGLVFGYGLARSLRRTIHQFLLRVQGASDLLGLELPTIEWQQDGEPLRDGADDLMRRVEQVVRKLQETERAVRSTERLAAVGQLAAGVAHEIRNPLTSAILLIETGRKDPTAGGLTDEDLDLIEQELHRIERSLRTLLDYARPPKLERTECDLAGIVRDALNLTRGHVEQQHVVVRLQAPTEPCLLTADRELLRQVVLNLILNALDVMPQGGELDLEIKPVDDSGMVELRVADSGPGIAPEILPRLFEPFATGKETGLGLGLVVSKRIVEDHGGTIRGLSEPGKGACFVVRLPVRLAETPAVPRL